MHGGMGKRTLSPKLGIDFEIKKVYSVFIDNFEANKLISRRHVVGFWRRKWQILEKK
jgi:hypothetical protein